MHPSLPRLLTSWPLLTLLSLLSLLALVAPAASAAEVEPGSGSWPLRPPPAVVRGFDRPSSAWEAGHRGADLAGRVGQPVRAAQAGTVSFVGRIAGVGSVSVSHGSTRTTYQPVEASVRRGAAVAEGAVIGHLALVGSHCLPRVCLHWGLIAGDTYLDPLILVGAAPQPVRLLSPSAPLPRAAAFAPVPDGWSTRQLPTPVGGREPEVVLP